MLDSQGRARVLVLTDDGAVRRMVSQVLCREGHEVVDPPLHERGVEVDLVILDAAAGPSLVAPADGCEAPVLALCAPEEAAARGLPMSVADAISLPLQAEELARRVRTQLELRALRQALREKEAMLSRAHERLAVSDSALRSNALVDPLMGIWNRPAFEARLAEELARATRHRTCLALALIDLDRFAEFNLTHGSDAGDTVLETMGEIVRRTTRGSDFVARYDGEAVAVLIPEGERAQAVRVAERIRKAIYDADILHRPNVPWERVTASAGVAVCALECGGGDGEVTGCAERALSRSKRTGRNKVTAAECAYTCSQQVQQACTGTWG